MICRDKQRMGRNARLSRLAQGLVVIFGYVLAGWILGRLLPRGSNLIYFFWLLIAGAAGIYAARQYRQRKE